MENKKRFSQLESGLKGALQGATLGFEDELAGAIGTGLDKSQELLNKLGIAGKSPSQVDKEVGLDSDMYSEFRDAARKENEQAQEQNPMSYGAGQMAGASLPMMATGALASGANVAKLGALENLAQGVGSSATNSLQDLGTDALQGLAMGGISKIAPKSMMKAAGKTTAHELEKAVDKGFGKLVVSGGNKQVFNRTYSPEKQKEMKKDFVQKLVETRARAAANPELKELSQQEVDQLLNKIRPLYKNK